MYAHKIDLSKYFTHKIQLDTFDKEIIMSKEELQYVFKEMLRMRTLEESAYNNYNKMRGFLHLTIGQESIYAALSLCMQKNRNAFDLIGSYRCHTLAYISGSSFTSICNELLGKENGMCKGKGGSMHLYNDNFYGGHGIVGAQVPLGTGLAFAIKYRRDVMNETLKKAVFCFFGDGASNQGQIYESYNLALIYKLPIIYVIENNKYGMWTSNEDVSYTDDFYKRWFDMRGIRVKSNSLFVLLSLFRKIIKMVDDGPLVVQIDTYRHCGHAMNDQQKYRTKEEKENELKNDCIEEVLEKLIQIGCEKECEKIENDVKKEIAEAFANAEKVKLPNENELYKDILI
ncbi:alpha subunit of pyruvate dehydrogenase [Conglomerata obtusa]